MDLATLERRLTPLAKAVMRRLSFNEHSFDVEDLVQEGVLAYLPLADTPPLARRRAEGAMRDYVRRAFKHRVVPEPFNTHQSQVLPRKVKRAMRGMRKAHRTVLAKWLAREPLTSAEQTAVVRARQRLAAFLTPKPPTAPRERRCARGHLVPPDAKRCPACRSLHNAAYHARKVQEKQVVKTDAAR